MSDQNFPENDGQEPPGDNADLQPEESQSDAPSPEQEISELNDRILRIAAELENTRRRAAREKVDAGRYAIAGFARDLLAVADNFDRALRAAGIDGDSLPEGRSEAFMGLLSGIQMTEKELLSVLERHGVNRIDAAGEKFDPNLHQAVAQVPDATVPTGHVVDVAQPGFTIGERVLRAAMVTVSSGAAAGNAPETEVKSDAS